MAKSASPASLRKDLLVGFDALQQVHAALTDRLGHCAIFCADECGGDVIGVKWRPRAWLPGPFRVATAHTCMPCMSGGEVGAGMFVVDTAAVVQEIKQIGSGVVADVLLCC